MMNNRGTRCCYLQLAKVLWFEEDFFHLFMYETPCPFKVTRLQDLQRGYTRLSVWSLKGPNGDFSEWTLRL